MVSLHATGHHASVASDLRWVRGGLPNLESNLYGEVAMKYRNIKVAQEDHDDWKASFSTIREIVDKQPDAQLAAFVVILWFDDLSLCIVPVGPDDLTAEEGLTLIKAATAAIDELAPIGQWKKADIFE